MDSFIKKLSEAWQLVFKRSLSSWKLLSSVVLGMLLASGIMAGTIIYFDALREVALRVALDKLTVREIDILIQGSKGPTTKDEYRRVATLTQSVIDENVDWMVDEQYTAGKSLTFFLTDVGNEQMAGEDDARSYFAYLPELEQHSTLVSGRLPKETKINNPGQPLEIEAIIPSDAAELFNVGVADRLSAVPHWDDDTPSVTVVISGIFERDIPGGEYWYLEDGVLNSATGPTFRTVPFLVADEVYFNVIGSAFPRMDSTYAWLLSVDASRINANNSMEALSDIETMNALMISSLGTYRQETTLDNTLKDYDRRLFFSKLPMFVVLILIAIVILYYVTTLASLTVEERSGEVALLRSRGATGPQILTVFILEGLTIATIAIALGPILASSSISLFGYTPAFTDLTGGGPLVTTISPLAYAMSFIGGALSFIALIIPAIQASRITVTKQRQQLARPTSGSTLQKYYIDVVLLLVCILLFRQLTQQGSVVAVRLFGDMAVNQLLLALPGMMLLASAMVLLRLFPLAIRMASRLFSSWLPAGLVLGIWQMARNPSHYARLSLLLILTAGLGIFASSFGATLDRSFEERILYSTGSDIRLDGVREYIKPPVRHRWWSRTPTPTPTPFVSPTPRPTIAEAYGNVEGVTEVTSVFRSRGSDLSKGLGQSITVLAMEPTSFPEVAWFRDDFSDTPINELLTSIVPENELKGLQMPMDATVLNVRLKGDRPHRSVRVKARVRNARSHYATYTLGQLESSEWLNLETDLRIRNTSTSMGRGYTVQRQVWTGPRTYLASSLPLTLVSLSVEESNTERRLLSGSVILDEISVQTASGEKVVLESFTGTSEWSVLKVGADSVADILKDSTAEFDGYSDTAIFSWGGGGALVPRGIFYGRKREHIPVLASESFMSDSGHSNGDQFEVSVGGFRVPVRLQGSVSLFPTITDPDEKFLVADLTTLRSYANLGAGYRSLNPNEIWISTKGEESLESGLVGKIDEIRGFTKSSVQIRQELLSGSKVDPLVKAGWRSLLFIAFGAVLALSCIGFLVHAYVSFRNRQLQFALLRTIGLSSGQLITMVWIEQTIIIAVGMALGTWMGGRLSATIMPFLGHDDWGGQVIPPFILEVNWGALLTTYAIMLAVFAVITFGIIWLIHRISVQRILRLGEG